MHWIKKGFCITVLSLITLCYNGSGNAAVDIASEDSSNTGFYYTIQKGDTLWDLSQKFYQSNWVWPGLWEMNDQLKNPHWIYPGNKIQIFFKEEAGKKQVSVQKKPESQTPVPIKHISFTYPGINSIGFIRETAVEPLGQILKAEKDIILMTQEDIIYIEPLGSQGLIPGDFYQIYTTEMLTQNLGKTVFSGVKHFIKGIIKVLEHNGSYVKAKIIVSYRASMAGDYVMPFNEKKTSIDIIDPLNTIDSRIICTEENNLMIGDKTIAFINQGSNNQIEPGQIYTIFQEQSPAISAGTSKPVQFKPIESGSLIVLHTEKISSTVMIISTQQDIQPGDFVR